LNLMQCQQLALDDRGQDLERAHDEEEVLDPDAARRGLVQAACRNPFGFTYTPLFKAALDGTRGVH